jgi:hypothetical protein
LAIVVDIFGIESIVVLLANIGGEQLALFKCFCSKAASFPPPLRLTLCLTVVWCTQKQFVDGSGE